MNAVTESIRVSIDRLTHLLQLSLSPYNPENARLLTKTIVDLIDHTTKLSMETNDLINKHKKREHELCSCLVEMDTLVKRQRKKLQAVPTKALTRDVDTNTVDMTCNMCRTHEGTIANLKATVDDLNEKNGVLRGKFVQSKCLIQAQQVHSKDLPTNRKVFVIHSFLFSQILLAKRSQQEVLERTSKSGREQRDIENTKDVGLWNEELETNTNTDYTRRERGSSHASHHIDEIKTGLPPKIPPRSRYDTSVTEENEEMDKSIEGFPPPSNGYHWRTAPDLQQARLFDYDEHLLEEEEVQDEHEEEEEEGEEGEEAASLDYYRREHDEEEEERHDGEDDGDAEADYHGSSGDRSHEYDDKDDSREVNSSDSGSGSRNSSGSGASNDDEEQSADQNQEYFVPPQQNRQQYRQQRPARHSLDLSSDGTLDGERVDGDEAEHKYHRSGHPQQRQYHTHSAARLTQEEGASAPVPGPGWDNHLNDNVEDSFSLIQNFYDVGFT